MSDGTESDGQESSVERARQLLPGLGSPTLLSVEAASIAAGKTLAELNLRGRTGATVLAIARDGTSLLTPRADERIQGGDVLAIVGTREAVDAARELLAMAKAPA
jgi:CPA2 family monovalent cation:H+ antiporter-2